MARVYQKYLTVLSQRLVYPLRWLKPFLKKFKLAYVLAAVALLLVVGSFFPVNNRYAAQVRVGNWPWFSSPHAAMALAWFQNGREDKALKEARLTKGEDLKRTEEVISQPGKIRGEIASWEKILQLMPYHREILLRLSVLYASLYQNQKAQEYFDRARYLNPLTSPLPVPLSSPGPSQP